MIWRLMMLILGLFTAYLLGSVPFALILVRLVAGVDVREIGSGNVGATNAARAFGKRGRIPMFALIYVLDCAKGLLPTLLGPSLFGFTGSPELSYQVLFGAAAILGHCTSPFLGFRGGKGVATTTGVIAYLAPYVLVVAFAMFFAVLGLTRQVFLGSLALGMTLAVGVIVEDPSQAFATRWPLTVFSLVVALFLFYTHRSNIQKMMARSHTA
jgi:glycerol-3-phosphate acyltransferase PlsY